MNTGDTDKRPFRDVRGAWIVVAIALVLRSLHVFFTQRFNPLASDLQLDAATYDHWARALAFGGDPGPTTLMQASVYPWLLSLLYRVFGPSLAAVRIAQALIGTASCGLIMFCARRIFRSTAAATLAGLCAAFYAPLIFYEGLLLPATIIVFFNVLFIAVLFTEGRPGAARLLLAGVTLGVAGAANPPTFLLFPFALLHLHFAGRPADAEALVERRTESAPPRFLRGSALLALGIAIALAPVTIGNALRTGEFLPITSGGGINFFHGNNSHANGFYQTPIYRGIPVGGTPEEQAINMARIASSESGRTLSQAEVSRFWLRVAFAYIRENPRAWGALVWRKFLFFWNGYERANVENLYFHRRFPGVLHLPLLTFGIIAPLGLLGMFLTRGRWRRMCLLYGVVVTYLLTALLFYVLSRYRLPVIVSLIPFAGAAVVELASLARGRRAAELALSLAALFVLAFFSSMTVASDTPAGVSGYYSRLGNVYIARGDTTEAEHAYRRAFELNASNEDAKRGLEIIRERTGRSKR